MSDLADLLDELDFESWLSYEGVRFKLTRGKSGVQANLRECPACGNSKWKVYINAESGVGNCFVCEERFSKWKFIKSHMNLSGSGTFQYIKSYMERQGWRPRKKEAVEVELPELLIPDSHALPINGKNLRYLTNRGITTELASYFHLRYCHEGEFAFEDANGDPQTQDYSQRVIIPVFDLDGQLVSFQGRDITNTAEKKYLFPPQFASTGSIIYNGQNAKESSRIVIGEGAFDCFAIKAAMDEDKVLREATACATFGKKLGPDQLDKLLWLKEHGKLKEVVFMWDAEEKAVAAAVAAALSCAAKGLPAKVAILPPGRDPNEVAAPVVREAIFNAVPINRMSAIQLLMKARSLKNKSLVT